MGTSLAVQWLRLHAPNAGGPGLIPGWGTKIPHAAQQGLKNKIMVIHSGWDFHYVNRNGIRIMYYEILEYQAKRKNYEKDMEFSLLENIKRKCSLLYSFLAVSIAWINIYVQYSISRNNTDCRRSEANACGQSVICN